MKREKIYGRSSQQDELGPGKLNLVPIAQNVAIQRGTLVAEAFFHMAAIRSLLVSPATGKDALIQCVAAHVQDASAQAGHQSAHLLPGQILIVGRPVWELAQAPSASAAPANEVPQRTKETQEWLASEVLRLAQQTQMCFSKTSVLPALFNRADSQAETSAKNGSTRGLKELFGAAVQEMWRAARVDPGRPLVIDREATLRGLKTWFDQVNAVYENASGRKNDASVRAQAQQDSRRAEDRSAEAQVLATYAESFKIVNVSRFSAANLPQVYERYGFL